VNRKIFLAKMKTITKHTRCIECRRQHGTCEPSDEPNTCQRCFKKNLICVKFKPQYAEQEIVRLNEIIHEKNKEIKSLNKQLITYRLLKQQVEQLFTIIEIDKE
jgi:hypothetical protein